MINESNESLFVIRHNPPSKSKGSWYFSIQVGMFVEIEQATVFTSAFAALAYANEFGVKLNRDTKIIQIKRLNDSTSE